MENDDLIPVTIRLKATVREDLARLAEADHRTFSNYLSLVLTRHVEENAKPGESEAKV